MGKDVPLVPEGCIEWQLAGVEVQQTGVPEHEFQVKIHRDHWSPLLQGTGECKAWLQVCGNFLKKWILNIYKGLLSS